MEYEKYSDVPWYRKNLFFILTALFFSPACLLVMWTGEVYWEKKGVLTVYGKGVKIVLTIILGGMLISGIANAVMSGPDIAGSAQPLVTKIVSENYGVVGAKCVKVKLGEQFAPNNWYAKATMNTGTKLNITIEYIPEADSIMVNVPIQ